MNVLLNYNEILSRIQSISYKTNLIVVCKNQELKNIDPLISTGHLHFGENRVQEALSKWQFLLQKNPHLNLHLIGKLQTNKAREAFKIFNYIHTLDTYLNIVGIWFLLIPSYPHLSIIYTSNLGVTPSISQQILSNVQEYRSFSMSDE